MLFLVKFAYELGIKMTVYDFLDARVVILRNISTDSHLS